jgi:hypothetical protein
MFVGEAESLPYTFQVLYKSRLRPYLQTLDRLEKLARDKSSSLILKLVSYGQKSFMTLAPGEA